MRWQYSLPYEWNLFHNVACVASWLYLRANIRIISASLAYKLHCQEKNKYLKLAPWSRDFIEKLTVPQPVKTLTESYATRRFVTAFTTPRKRVPTLRNINSVHAFPRHFFKIHFNIILSYNNLGEIEVLSRALKHSHCPKAATYKLNLQFFLIQLTCPLNLLRTAASCGFRLPGFKSRSRRNMCVSLLLNVQTDRWTHLASYSTVKWP